jgi:hypothetical protein
MAWLDCGHGSNTISDPLGHVYESDSSGCSSLSEDLIVIASSVSFAIIYIMHTCVNTGTDLNRTRNARRVDVR